MSKKLYARMMKAVCPVDPETMETTVPFLQHEIVPHAMADHGARQIFFFVDPTDGTVFSITMYDTEDDLANAMREAGSEYRFASLAKLGCTAVEARALEVVAGDVAADAPEVDFPDLIPPQRQ
ncbi:hypothetical protein [Nocardia pseudobrasiliensis]|uniref:Antibiotic biosynthesis monooxygenase n=1 Tax=Nocardia pseudobrasiliensis TaxID=45979 RepID=A0A370HYG7_9NOCA|nr:hypothetical protein [Nocardia pseudobrasiliensis]RDI63563.1 hypothetical protein DFR76_110260 [Nocardia pseudobrasiliensis]